MGRREINTIPFKRIAECEVLMAQLNLLKIAYIEVYFDGSGDSGNIDSVSAVDRSGNKVDLDKPKIMWAETHDVFEYGIWVPLEEQKLMSVSVILVQICSEALDLSNLDWYNNDGGYGSLVIDFATNPPTCKLDVHIRTTETVDYEFAMPGLFKEPEDAPKPPRANKRKNLRRSAK